ncbi:MAG: hypothetical protein LBB89_04050 [Treponema sp.]|jgi:hypothetical protein|nr:hypothetical protein [Treponema sp.]
MKSLSCAILAGVAVFFMLGCKTTVDYAKKYPNMVANVDPISAGTIEAEFDRIFSSKLDKTEIGVVFDPRLNAAVLEFKYEFVQCRQFWDQAARQQFVTALELYKTNYTERTLINKYKKTRAIYGKAKGRLEWETFKYAQTRVGYSDIELGYRFMGETPFFSAVMRSAKEEKSNGNSSRRLDSQQINMYFTRAQADDLVKLFDQSYLMGLLENNDSLKPEKPLVVDSYHEFGD